MQGRAHKAQKKELVIESPQQYKRLAAAEAEVESVPQVAVSHLKNACGGFAYEKISCLVTLMHKDIFQQAVLCRLTTVIKP